MKKTIVSTAIILVSFISSVSGQIKFSKFPGMDKAFAKSASANKPIFVDTYTDWCGWCKHMDKEIFSDENVATYFNENFLCMNIDGDAESSASFISKYEVSGYPCLLILDSEGNVLNRSDGAITDIDEFIEFGEMAYYKLYPETSPWKINESIYNEGNRDPKFLMEYALSMVDGEYDQAAIDVVVNEFWTAADAGNVEESDKFDMISSFHNAYDDIRLNYFIQNKSGVVDFYGEEYYYTKMVMVIVENLDEAVVNNDEALFNQTVKFAKKHFKDQELIPMDEVMDYITATWDER
jgi:thioredoxin-related protein